MLVGMRRPYTVATIGAWSMDPRPHSACVDWIGCDCRVPGETDADFAELEHYLAESPLTHVHVFPYSDRPGTDATAMKDKVHGSLVRERATRLREISRRPDGVVPAKSDTVLSGRH
jgi:tRNA A37 methylthiotransferase MiaB